MGLNVWSVTQTPSVQRGKCEGPSTVLGTPSVSQQPPPAGLPPAHLMTGCACRVSHIAHEVSRPSLAPQFQSSLLGLERSERLSRPTTRDSTEFRRNASGAIRSEERKGSWRPPYWWLKADGLSRHLCDRWGFCLKERSATKKMQQMI